MNYKAICKIIQPWKVSQRLCIFSWQLLREGWGRQNLDLKLFYFLYLSNLLVDAVIGLITGAPFWECLFTCAYKTVYILH